MTATDLEASFRDLLERNQTRWSGIARSYSEGSDRDDLLQEIALQVWRSLASFNGQAKIDTWAYRVALNTALGWRRRREKNPTTRATATPPLEQLPAALDSESMVDRVLTEFLASLSETDRALMLLYLDGVSYADVAEIMGLSEGSLRVRLHRIRKQFESTYGNGGTCDEVR